MASRVMASVTYEDVRRAYFEDLGDGPGSWAWWIRELVIDPPELIVSNDEDGTLWRVPYTTSDNAVTFGEPEAVRVEYVAAAAAPRRDGVTVFASRDESREGASTVDLTALRQSLGLPDSTPDTEVLRLAAERLAPPPPAVAETPAPTEQPDPPAQAPDEAVPPAATPAQSPPPPTPPTATIVEVAESAPTPAPEVPAATQPEMRIPEGAVLVDAAQWAAMQSRVQTGELAAGRLIREDRQRFIDSVIAAGRLSPQNTGLRSVLEAAWNRNPHEAEAIAQNLAVAFPVTEIGHAAGGIEAASAATEAAYDAQDVSMFPELARVRAGKVG